MSSRFLLSQSPSSRDNTSRVRNSWRSRSSSLSLIIIIIHHYHLHLEVEDLHVGDPDLLDEADVDRDEVVALSAEDDVLDQEPLVHPADEEETVESDAEVVVIHIRNVFDIDS